jgi:glyoxylase-like metal-dependent hydrolase (beta-lactamase superfamily II)
VLVLATQATVFAATCYVVAPRAGGPCLVLDPGVDVVDGVARLVEGHRLTLLGVTATHGHPDHLWDAAAVCARWDVPFYLAAADLERVDDPVGWLGPGMAEGFQALVDTPWTPPKEVAALPADALDLGDGLRLDLVPAPGHTPGSTVFLAPGAPDPASLLPAPVRRRPSTPSAVAFTGDVLFAGSIGRMDLPGGDEAAMLGTLAVLQRRLAPDVLLLPGHGPSSTMAAEQAQNPYLGTRWSRGLS